MHIRLLFVTLLLFATNYCLAQGTLTGAVLSAKDKEPVVGVLVTIFKFGKIVSKDTTDNDGYYIIEKLQSGDYDALFTNDGYNAKYYTRVIIRDKRTIGENLLLEPIEKNSIKIDTVEFKRW